MIDMQNYLKMPKKYNYKCAISIDNEYSDYEEMPSNQVRIRQHKIQ